MKILDQFVEVGVTRTRVKPKMTNELLCGFALNDFKFAKGVNSKSNTIVALKPLSFLSSLG